MPLTFSGTYRVRHGVPLAYTPTKPMRVTAIVTAKDQFGVRLSKANGADSTALFLENQYNLTSTVIITDQMSLVFEYNGSGDAVGFLSAEEVA